MRNKNKLAKILTTIVRGAEYPFNKEKQALTIGEKLETTNPKFKMTTILVRFCLALSIRTLVIGISSVEELPTRVVPPVKC